MIEHLAIKNFKSIKDLELRCKRVNLFIGEPNAGKSNLLEALGLVNWFSTNPIDLNHHEFVRFEQIQNLFYDDLIDNPVEIDIKPINAKLKVMFKNNQFRFDWTEDTESKKEQKSKASIFSINGILQGAEGDPFQTHIRYYRFDAHTVFDEIGPSYLNPPHGTNLFTVVMSNKKYRDIMASFLKKNGFKLVLKPQTKTFEFQKQVDEVVISYPYTLLSDTLQRIIFYIIAIESSKDATLVFEEPESHAFPYYTKYLGEKIGMDTSNQYFIATHNPYLLNAILEKTKKDSVNVFITYFEDYQTKVKSLSPDEISELMSHDPFFNLESFIKRDKD
jgi:AAA15 family ATPase/GTPase